MRLAIVRFHNLGEFAVTSRKPTFVRWAEEAEAKQVCEWAELEQACDPPDVDTARSHGSRERPPFLRRLRGMFGSQTVQLSETVNNKPVYHDRRVDATAASGEPVRLFEGENDVRTSPVRGVDAP